jgi:tetratricopeptide (TPR) repeat protein
MQYLMTRNDAIAAVRANPKNPDAWARLGTFLAEAGDAAKATECFMRALRIDGSCIEAKSGLAALHKIDTAKVVYEDPETLAQHAHDTRAWSPMTHILLANHQLTLDEARAMEAERAFGESSIHSTTPLSWMAVAVFPFVLWVSALLIYTLTPLQATLAATAPAARFLALASFGVVLLVVLGVATYGAQRWGKAGQMMVGAAWVVWLISFGSLIT